MKIIFIIEFKVIDEENQTCNALAQIKQPKYYEKYQQQAKLLYLVGIDFCKSKKNICGFEWELI